MAYGTNQTTAKLAASPADHKPPKRRKKKAAAKKAKPATPKRAR